jgi:hypothetical protein
MSYFPSLPKVLYKFGSEVSNTSFDNISVFADMIDDIKDVTSFHEKYTIPQGERPDQTSFNFYNTTEHYWTFFMLNDHIRLQGWPLPFNKLEEKVKEDFPNTVFTTKNDLTNIFKIGETATGTSSGNGGKIIKRHLDLGQIVVEGTVSFSAGETMSSSGGASVTSTGFTAEHLAIHHYEDSDNNYVDINPYGTVGAGLTPITNSERYTAENDKLKIINVIKPSFIEQISRGFKQAVRS